MRTELTEVACPCPSASPPSGGRAATEMAPRLRAGVALLLGAVIAMSVLLRMQNIGTVSYWFDESSSWKTIQFGWGEMWTPISRNVHPPVFYLSLKSWAVIFGDSPVSLRAFAVASGVLTVLAIYGFVLESLRGSVGDQAEGRGASRHVTALFAAALVGLSAMQIERSLQARMYTLGTLLAALCGVFALRIARTGGTWPQWIGFTVCGTLLSLTHYYGLFTLAAAYLFLGGVCVAELVRSAWRGSAGRLVLGTVFSAWATLNVWGLWLPSFLAQRAQVSASYWSRDFQWDALVCTCFELLTIQGGGRNAPEWNWLAVNFWATVCVLVAVLGGRGGRFVALAAGFPFVASIAYSLMARNIFVYRYLTFAQLFLLVGWALLAHRIPWRIVKVTVMVGSLGWFGYWSWQHSERREMQSGYSGLMDSVATLDQWRNPGDRVIVGSAMVHPTVQRYTFRPEDVFVVDRGRPYVHFQGGPILREVEYFPLTSLATDRAERVFTVDVYDMYRKGARSEVRVPVAWVSVRAQEFEERFQTRCRVVVREYRRRGPAASGDGDAAAVM